MTSIPSPNIPSIDDILETFEFFDSWEDRFTYLIDMGKKLPELSEADKTEANRVHGCQATVYLTTIFNDGKISITAHANAHIVNGLITILTAIYNHKTPDQILATDTAPTFKTLGLEEHLSPTRRNGLHAMTQRIRAIAEAALNPPPSPTKVSLTQVDTASPSPATQNADNADAPYKDSGLDDNDTATLYERVIRAAQTVFDPEIPVSIYELGLIYNIDINPKTYIVNIQMTLTTPNCPEAQSLPLSLEQAVAAVNGVTEANVTIVWEPTWTKDMMSEAAQLQLGLI